MKLSSAKLCASVGLVAAVAVSTPAAADFWWETDQGTLYFDGAAGNWGVFRFLDKEKGQTLPGIAIYINGLGPQYTGTGIQPGTYDAQWFNYSGEDCGEQVADPEGNVSSNWGVMSFTINQDYNYFSADVYNCREENPVTTFNGTPGT